MKICTHHEWCPIKKSTGVGLPEPMGGITHAEGESVSKNHNIYNSHQGQFAVLLKEHINLEARTIKPAGGKKVLHKTRAKPTEMPLKFLQLAYK